VAQSPIRSMLPAGILAAGQVLERESPRTAIASQVLDWPGMLIETGKNQVEEVDDLVLAQHYLSLNLDPAPLTLEVKGGHGFKTFKIPPRSIWVCPAGEPLTLRLKSHFSYVRISIADAHLRKLLGQEQAPPMKLRRSYGVAVPQIHHLIEALAAETRNRNPGGLALVEAMTAALGHLLVRHVAVEQPRQELPRGGLSPSIKRRTLEMIDARLSGKLTVEMLAQEVGLSPAHYARAFKQTIGRAPHQYLLSLRLERARRLLEAPGLGLGDVAHQTGFADQAHFSRLFKREYGITPGAVAR
jgi:AraC family transcriptional regulator